MSAVKRSSFSWMVVALVLGVVGCGLERGEGVFPVQEIGER